MSDATTPARALGDNAARQLANATKTVPQYDIITPRWLVRLLQWVPVEAGIYRREPGEGRAKVTVDCAGPRRARIAPNVCRLRELRANTCSAAVNTVVDVHTRISDLYSVPYNQIREQLRLTIEIVKERQESELINNAEYGLLHNAAPQQRIKTRNGAPTPDDLDELLVEGLERAGFFLAHPPAIAAFGRECTRRGVPPPTVSLFGTPFNTWRGIPLIPSDKLAIDDGKTNILFVRTGERNRAWSDSFSPICPASRRPGFRCASWASTTKPSRRTWYRFTARSRS